MSRKGMAEDEFVDLYNLMELPPDAEATAIRKRINELYLEAQQNLDHRNVKKRLQYQQMYELYLPQARHLLLDPSRRAEYDRYLKAYHSGHLPPPAPEPLWEETETSTDVSTNASTDASKVSFEFDDAELEAAQEPIDPEKQAAEREQLWARWKTGLEHVLVDDTEPVAAQGEYQEADYQQGDYQQADYSTDGEYSAQEYTEGAYASGEAAEATPFDSGGTAANVSHAPVPAPHAHTAHAQTAHTQTAHTQTAHAQTAHTQTAHTQTAHAQTSGAAAHPVARPVARRAAAIDPELVDLNDPQKVKEIEHQREVRRYSLIKQAAERAGLFWGWGTGTGFFFGACILFYLLDEYLTRTNNHPLDRSIFNALCLIGIIFLSVLVGWMASSSARQRIIDELSHLPLPDLVRRTRGS